MELRASGIIACAVEKIDLGAWLFSLTDTEYQEIAIGHRALGTFQDHGRRGMINVESIGGNLLIQHYFEVKAETNYVEMHSPKTRGYLLHLVPLPIEVRWIMQINRKHERSCLFECKLIIGLPGILKYVSKFIGVDYFISKHLKEETIGFIKSIESKCLIPKAVSV